MMTATLILALGLGALPDNPTALALWPNKIPGPTSSDPKNVPTFTVYPSPLERANNPAVVVCPGGGYSGRAADHEGKQIAAWLNERGFAAFILKYRTTGESQIKPPLEPGPMLDVQRAIRLVRAKGKDYGIDPKRVGVWGFSAGGHLASTAATHFDSGKTDGDDIDKQSCRPDFAILAYPVITMTEKTHGGSRANLVGRNPDPKLIEFYSNEKQVTKDTPPTFLFHTVEDTAVPVENSRMFKAACERAAVPVELVEMEKGVHGIGLGGARAKGLPAENWPAKLEVWLKGRGLMDRN